MRPLPEIEAMQVVRQTDPFDHDDWLFEIKHDGFRAIAYIENGQCKLVGRRPDFGYKRFRYLTQALPSEVNAKSAILDGEIVAVDRSGKARFLDLLSGRGFAMFAAFDLMWLNGRDLRDQPLWQRKELLQSHLKPSRRVAFVDHVEGKGKWLYEQICLRHMEGMICKLSISQYRRSVRKSMVWTKVTNPNYCRASRSETQPKRYLPTELLDAAATPRPATPRHRVVSE